jgi:hypothetical protein
MCLGRRWTKTTLNPARMNTKMEEGGRNHAAMYDWISRTDYAVRNDCRRFYLEAVDN